ncbi:hypothetical protein OZ668_05155 [Elizabethkingia sp. HX XZB]|uniref:hypothetical protein n=1 Tax=Elizabethkingia sp. HX XZB TaxID=3003193 RepID=UPI002A24697D|nr:hypothetical protein [Elizabethkingia sp. HX XZB]MDX8567359.1 hypothetical protein [Elizabethkingia sp. HX XZB]
MKKILSITPLAILYITISCEKNIEPHGNPMFSEDGTRISDSMMDVMQKHLDNVTEKHKPNQKNNHTEPYPPTDSLEDKSKQNKKYAFVVLTVREISQMGANYTNYEKRQYVSQINEIIDYNEDSKAMFEDAIIQNYKVGAWQGDIVSKETHAFDNYASASKKRNSFIVEQQ